MLDEAGCRSRPGTRTASPAWSSIAMRRCSSCNRAARAPIACATSSSSCCSRRCPSSRTRSSTAPTPRCASWKLDPIVETIRGAVDGPVLARDGDLLFEVDVFQGHKTGHYLDQSLNRRAAAGRAEGGRVLDAFSYDGLFGLHAALAGPSRSCASSRTRARASASSPTPSATDCSTGQGRARRLHEGHARPRRARGALRAGRGRPAGLRPFEEGGGGRRARLRRAQPPRLRPRPRGRRGVSASCSYNVSPADFVKFIGRAANLAGRDVWLEELTKAAPDHPHLVTLPESDYLKCAFLRVG